MVWVKSLGAHQSCGHLWETLCSGHQSQHFQPPSPLTGSHSPQPPGTPPGVPLAQALQLAALWYREQGIHIGRSLVGGGSPPAPPVCFTEAPTPHSTPAGLPPAPGPLGSPAPGSQSHDLWLHTDSPCSNPDEKRPRARDHGASAMIVIEVVEEEVGKSWDQAAAIPSGKQGKCVPGIPIWTWNAFIHGNLGWRLCSVVQLAWYYMAQTLEIK